MSFRVTVQPSGRQFEVEEGETVLTAAIRQHVALPYACKSGSCGTCKGQLLEGEVEHGYHRATALSEEEKARGLALLCQARPKSELIIEAREVKGVGEIPIKKLPCRVISVTRPVSDVAVVQLQLPASERLQFLAGQYVEFMLKDGQRRCYSIANPPHQEGPMELHIRHTPGGLFTDHVFGVGPTQLKERDILRFEGPMGTFFFREGSTKPVILLASGTGFAPIKALAEDFFHKKLELPITLYWGCRSLKDMYMRALPEQWAQQYPNFRFVPVLSAPLAEDGWTGRTGYVHEAVMQDIQDLSGYQVYACGAPAMVDSAKRDFTQRCALPEDAFYADAFTTQADVAAG